MIIATIILVNIYEPPTKFTPFPKTTRNISLNVMQLCARNRRMIDTHQERWRECHQKCSGSSVYQFTRLPAGPPRAIAENRLDNDSLNTTKLVAQLSLFNELHTIYFVSSLWLLSKWLGNLFVTHRPPHLFFFTPFLSGDPLGGQGAPERSGESRVPPPICGRLRGPVLGSMAGRRRSNVAASYPMACEAGGVASHPYSWRFFWRSCVPPLSTTRSAAARSSARTGPRREQDNSSPHPPSPSLRCLFFVYLVPRPAATTLNFSEFSSPYSSMAGAADGLDPDGSNKSAFMEIQQQGLAGMAHHGQPYPIRSTYSSAAAPQHEAAFASAQHPRPLGANPFPMNYNPLHNTYSHPSHPYLSTYPANVPTCPSPTRDGKSTLNPFFSHLPLKFVFLCFCMLALFLLGSFLRCPRVAGSITHS